MSQPKQGQTRQSHTPGPWKPILLDGEWYVNPDRDSGQYALICRVHPKPGKPGLSETHARLIAAAPEMLEALREALNWIVLDSGEGTIYQTVKAAILKAEGTGTMPDLDLDYQVDKVQSYAAKALHTMETTDDGDFTPAECADIVRMVRWADHVREWIQGMGYWDEAVAAEGRDAP